MKRLPEEFLHELGPHDLPEGVGIPYRDYDGTILHVKRRTALRAKDGSWWPKGVPLMPYGRERLAEARRTGELILAEGESDPWALWHAGMNALGIPGSSATGCLEAEDVVAIERIYISQEPDSSGPTFVRGLHSRLSEIDWRGESRVVRFPIDGAKDPAELWALDPPSFVTKMRAAMTAADPLDEADDFSSSSVVSRVDEWPEPVADAGYHGLAGEFVRLVAPHSEADPVALLTQLLVGFGNLIGRGCYFRAEADRHYTNLDLLLGGETSKGRKGSSLGHALKWLKEIDPDWGSQCIQSGLSSGEGLIWAVRDPITKSEPIKQKGRVTGYQQVETDPGVLDKRLLAVSTEFASVAAVMERDGNTLSATLRQAWDSGDLRVMTKTSPAKATGAHISAISHITADELRRSITRTELGNGFMNRILVVCVRRSNVLPDGGTLETVDFSYFVTRLRAAFEFAKGLGEAEFKRDDGARALWHEIYEDLSAGRAGLLGAVTSRAEAQTMRLALIYAILDRSRTIQRVHLEAALALWRYVDASASSVWGDSLGDPVADEVLRALRTAGPTGMTRTDISAVFQRNREAAQIGSALAGLASRGLARFEKRKTAGRTVERWFAVRLTNETNKTNKGTAATADGGVRSFLSSISSPEASETDDADGGDKPLVPNDDPLVEEVIDR